MNSGAQVSLSSVVVVQNRAVGGEITQESLATGTVQTVASGGNGRDVKIGMGGGVLDAAGSLSVSNSTISRNQAQGSDGSRGRDGESARGASKEGANGQSVMGESGANGVAGATAFGGGIYNAKGANLTLSGAVLSSNMALGGRGGTSGSASGAGIWIGNTATMTIAPRMGAKKGPKQFRSIDTITANRANRGAGGAGGSVAGVTIGQRGAPNGSPGRDFFAGMAGVAGVSGDGTGSGLVRIPGSVATIANTKITGNNTSNSGNDISDH